MKSCAVLFLLLPLFAASGPDARVAIHLIGDSTMAEKPDLVLFAGDMVGSGNCYTFEGFKIPVKLVYGNNDCDRVGLFREFARVGGEYLGDFGEIEADGLKIALMHGTDEPLVK